MKAFHPLLSAATSLVLFAVPALAQKSLRSPDHLTQQMNRESAAPESRQEHDDYQTAARYWYESRNPKHLDDMDAALKRIMPSALLQSGWVLQVPDWEEAHRCQAYHDAGAILLARCYTLMYYGREAEAKDSLRLINDKFPHSLILYPDRQTVLVRKQLRYHMHACNLYRAIRERKMYEFIFPPEVDEHDAWAQSKAAEDMAMLRLREGDFDSLDHLASQARLRKIKMAAGELMTDAIYSGMHPLENESWSAAAWDEMGGRIRQWREKKPTSTDARLGEVVFMIYRFKKYSEEAGSTQAYSKELRNLIQKVGPVAPQIGFVQVLISLIEKEGLEKTAAAFKQAHDRDPDYTPTLMLMLMRLGIEQNGLELCTAMLNEMAASEHPEQVARILAHIPEKAMKSLSAGLSVQKLRKVLNAYLDESEGSLAARNRIGLLAVRLGQDDIAMTAMSPVGDRWDRLWWRGNEFEATRLTERRIVRGGAKAAKVTQL